MDSSIDPVTTSPAIVPKVSISFFIAFNFWAKQGRNQPKRIVLKDDSEQEED
jgi:hypothetical protein